LEREREREGEEYWGEENADRAMQDENSMVQCKWSWHRTERAKRFTVCDQLAGTFCPCSFAAEDILNTCSKKNISTSFMYELIIYSSFIKIE